MRQILGSVLVLLHTHAAGQADACVCDSLPSSELHRDRHSVIRLWCYEMPPTHSLKVPEYPLTLPSPPSDGGEGVQWLPLE